MGVERNEKERKKEGWSEFKVVMGIWKKRKEEKRKKVVGQEG